MLIQASLPICEKEVRILVKEMEVYQFNNIPSQLFLFPSYVHILFQIVHHYLYRCQF
jgi:hypothetical protein